MLLLTFQMHLCIFSLHIVVRCLFSWQFVSKEYFFLI